MEYPTIMLEKQASNCLLCHNAKCTQACPHQIQAAQIIRSVRFENTEGARALLPEQVPCLTCETQKCQNACIRKQIDYPVQIKDMFVELGKKTVKEKKEVDLSTSLCGVPCENPFFLSSSVVGNNYEMVAKAFDMGWAGVAFKTIGMFVPDEVSPRFDQLQKEGEPFLGFKNIEQISEHTLEENLAFFRQLKKEYPTKIIIASIMGRDEKEWEELARLVEEAGADVIECNFSCPHMTGGNLGSDVGTHPELVAAFTKAAKRGSKLPLLAKMTPNITNMELPAIAAVEAGADGIAAINTIKSIMNINPDTYISGPSVEGKSAVGGYSGKAVKPIALRFIYDMKSNDLLKDIPVSGMGGIETWRDVLEFMMMGCTTIQITTAVMQYGYRVIDDLIDGLSRYMAEHDMTSIEEVVGKAIPNILPADNLNRHSICYPKFNTKACVGCGRCYLSCYDGGHQALQIAENGHPLMDATKCVGCHLCLAVCPAGAIEVGPRVEK